MAAIAESSAPVRVAERAPNAARRIDLGRIGTHVALLLLVILWTFPTAGLLISSLRDIGITRAEIPAVALRVTAPTVSTTPEQRSDLRPVFTKEATT